MPTTTTNLKPFTFVATFLAGTTLYPLMEGEAITLTEYSKLPATSYPNDKPLLVIEVNGVLYGSHSADRAVYAEYLAKIEAEAIAEVEIAAPVAKVETARPLSEIEPERIAARDAKEKLTDRKFIALKAGRMDDYWRLGDEEAKAQQVFNALNIEARNAGKVW